jgi:endogenous inhibitor of DNA gyrase (YacG/DUF329 family)
VRSVAYELIKRGSVLLSPYIYLFPLTMIKLCASCGKELPERKQGETKFRKYCSKKCLKEWGYNQYKSVYKAAGLGEGGPSGIYEGEYTTNTYACSYDEYPVDPEILAQAELNEARSDNTYRASLSKTNGMRINRGGKSCCL